MLCVSIECIYNRCCSPWDSCLKCVRYSLRMVRIRWNKCIDMKTVPSKEISVNLLKYALTSVFLRALMNLFANLSSSHVMRPMYICSGLDAGLVKRHHWHRHLPLSWFQPSRSIHTPGIISITMKSVCIVHSGHYMLTQIHRSMLYWRVLNSAGECVLRTMIITSSAFTLLCPRTPQTLELQIFGFPSNATWLQGGSTIDIHLFLFAYSDRIGLVPYSNR